MTMTEAMRARRRNWWMRAMSAASGGVIRLSASSIAEDASVGDAVGTLSVAGATGTPSFTLEDDGGGLFALDGDVLEVADALSAGNVQIEVSVSGVTPAVDNRFFTIVITTVSVNDELLLSDGASNLLLSDGSSVLLLSA